MNAGRMFWGSFFVLLGVLLLLEIGGAIVYPYIAAWRFWPLLLVFWGLLVLFREYRWRWIFAALGGILMALILYDAYQSVWPPRFSYEDTAPLAEDYEFPYEQSPERASLRIEAPLGAFEIIDSTHMLIRTTSRPGRGHYSLRRSRRGGRETVSLESIPVKTIWLPRTLRNNIALWLNPTPVWDIDADVGAARLNLDLRSLRVSTVTVDAGAANVEIRLGGRYEETTVRIAAGASSVKLLIPDDAGCELRKDGAISGKNLHGLEKIASGLYRTKDFDMSRQKIYVDVDLGVGRLRLDRLPKEMGHAGDH